MRKKINANDFETILGEGELNWLINSLRASDGVNAQNPLRRKSNRHSRICSNSSEKTFLQLFAFQYTFFAFHERWIVKRRRISLAHFIQTFWWIASSHLARSFSQQKEKLWHWMKFCFLRLCNVNFSYVRASTHIFIYCEFPLIFSELPLVVFCLLILLLPLNFASNSSTFSPAWLPLSALRVLRHFARCSSFRFDVRCSAKALERRLFRSTVALL